MQLSTLLIKKHQLKTVLFLALIITIVTAIYSNGYFHADEHYQIIEFAGFKLGTHAPNELAWEFHSQIRPTLQPTIAFVLFELFSSIGLENPYHQTFLLRLITGIFALFAITFFIKKTEHLIQNERIYYLLSYFLWFIPFISVRFSSETWSALFFLLATAQLISKNKPHHIGILIGISFLFRFQIAFAVVGMGIWILWVQKKKINYWVRFILSFVGVILIGTLIDSWFYGNWVFTPWNYFHFNIIQGVAASFGTSPWWYYLENTLFLPHFIIGGSILLSFLIVCIRYPKNLFIWCLVAFTIGHSLVGHKEERFLFPMVYFFPIILTLSYDFITNKTQRINWLKWGRYLFVFIFFAINTVGLVVFSKKSAGIGRTEITKYIHQNYPNKTINLIYTPWSSPYSPWGLPKKFYAKNLVSSHNTDNITIIDRSIIDSTAQNLFVLFKRDKANPVFNELDLVFKTQSVPNWIIEINKLYPLLDTNFVIELYEVDVKTKTLNALSRPKNQ